MNKMKVGLAIGAVVLVIAAFFGINNGIRSQETEAAESAGVPVTAITASAGIIADAVVVPVRESDLSMATGGIVSAVLVEEGDTVQAGEPLVQIKDERLQASLAQAEANLANAQAQLADLLAPPRDAEVSKYQANITSAQASLEDVLAGASDAEIAAKKAELANAEAALRLAQSDYDEVSWRSDIGRLPESLELEQATNNYNAAKAALDDLLAAADDGDIAGAAANVVAAQADLALLLAGAEQDAIDAARATVAANEAIVRDARAALAEATLVAPFSGTIAGVNVAVGEQVSVGTAVIQLADTTQWRIETEDLTELDVVNVEKGDVAEISFDALEDTILTGRVKNIKPLGENNQGDITYTVLIELDARNEGAEQLRWNMSAETTITKDEAGRAAMAEGSSRVDLLQRIEDALSAESMGTRENETLTNSVSDSTAGPHTVSVETEAAARPGTVATGGAGLNVRNGPGTSFEIVAMLDNGNQVDVVGSNDTETWLQVVLPNGEQGWVAAEFVVVWNGDAGSADTTDGQTGL